MSTFQIELRALQLEVNASYYEAEEDRAAGWDIEEVYVCDDSDGKWLVSVDTAFLTEIYGAIEQGVAAEVAEARVERAA